MRLHCNDRPSTLFKLSQGDSTPEEIGHGDHGDQGPTVGYTVDYGVGYTGGFPLSYPEEVSSGYASDSAAGGQEPAAWEDGVRQQPHRWAPAPQGSCGRARSRVRFNTPSGLHRHGVHGIPAAATALQGYGNGAQAVQRLQQAPFQAAHGVHVAQPATQYQERHYVMRGGWTAQQSGERSDVPRSTGTSGSGSGSSVSSASAAASWADEAAASRARWGDRGVGVGHLWEPCEDGALADGAPRLPPVLLRAGAPAWMHRGLRSIDGDRDR